MAEEHDAGDVMPEAEQRADRRRSGSGELIQIDAAQTGAAPHAVSDTYVARRLAEHLAATAEADRRNVEQQIAAGAAAPESHFGFYLLLGILMATLLLVVIYAGTGGPDSMAPLPALRAPAAVTSPAAPAIPSRSSSPAPATVVPPPRSLSPPQARPTTLSPPSAPIVPPRSPTSPSEAVPASPTVPRLGPRPTSPRFVIRNP